MKTTYFNSKRLLKSSIIWLILLGTTSPFYSQSYTLSGTVSDELGPLVGASVEIASYDLGTVTDINGAFSIIDISEEEIELLINYIGYKEFTKPIKFNTQNHLSDLNIRLAPSINLVNPVVVTGTKTFKRKTDSPVVVNVIGSKTLDNLQACNLSEGLKFQPGLRVETDCQTCNYTQLRMNGLAGGYSQILVNGRPILSPLTGLYGLEQLPVNMVDRIEVIRGGGSSLYGSSAIGGTVNVLTKLPSDNSYSLNYAYQRVGNQTHDHNFNANASLTNQAQTAGLSIFLNTRDRNTYDHNEDGFSELPSLQNRGAGINSYYRPTENQKLELSLSYLNEYRYGGEIQDQAAHLALQSEERTSNVGLASLDYQWNFNDEKSKLITYVAGQYTDRSHFTGIKPDGGEELAEYIANPPYGDSEASTLQLGTQLNHNWEGSPFGQHILTAGVEYLYDQILDEIPSYRYLVDQTTEDLGLFAQSDWSLTNKLSLLSGIRVDRHNLVDGLVYSPRLSMLYKAQQNTQFRLSYGTGFRAPQAFDADLHIAFAGGGISRVSLDPELAPEQSKSISASVNYDKITEKLIVGFTVEGFYTRLNKAFILDPIGEDEFGEVFIKRNGDNATVQGITLELRANLDRKYQLESGFTIQKSEFSEAVEYIDGVAGITDFIRTPNLYGFANLSMEPVDNWKVNLNYVYTGSMIVPHFAGAPNQLVDEIIDTNTFSEINMKFSYLTRLANSRSTIELYAGVKNLFNAYQNDFDIGKDRDSNYIYGPAQPRTPFIGVKLFN